jgi:hypothetical protein
VTRTFGLVLSILKNRVKFLLVSLRILHGCYFTPPSLGPAPRLQAEPPFLLLKSAVCNLEIQPAVRNQVISNLTAGVRCHPKSSAVPPARASALAVPVV